MKIYIFRNTCSNGYFIRKSEKQENELHKKYIQKKYCGRYVVEAIMGTESLQRYIKG